MFQRGELGTRGLEFLLDKNRLNGAISHAKTLAIVVGDPRRAHAGDYGETNGTDQLVLWTFTNLISVMIANYFIQRDKDQRRAEQETFMERALGEITQFVAELVPDANFPRPKYDGQDTRPMPRALKLRFSKNIPPECDAGTKGIYVYVKCGETPLELVSISFTMADNYWNDWDFGSEAFTIADIPAGLKLDSLVKALLQNNTLAGFLLGGFAQGTRDRLAKYAESGEEMEPTRKSLLTEFRQIRNGECIYTEDRFAAFKLRPITCKKLEKTPELKNEVKQRLNRLLLEDAFPQLVKYLNKRLRLPRFDGHR